MPSSYQIESFTCHPHLMPSLGPILFKLWPAYGAYFGLGWNPGEDPKEGYFLMTVAQIANGSPEMELYPQNDGTTLKAPNWIEVTNVDEDLAFVGGVSALVGHTFTLADFPGR